MIKKILIVILITLLVFVIVINLPIVTVGHRESGHSYSNWMSETLSVDKRIVDVAMPGAHDAFTSQMNLFSPADKYADGIMKGFTGTILKGFLLRQSVTQKADAGSLLESGVRYLDIRLTYDNGRWVTKHNFVSGDFIPVAGDIVSFLQNNKGEFLILDFQHINGIDYNSEEDYGIFIDMLTDTGLLGFHYFTADGVGSITYGDITDHGKSSRVVIIDKFNVHEKETYDYDSSIRSNWADDDSFVDVLQFLKNEAVFVNNSTDLSDSFRVMQAVTTLQLSLPGIFDSLRTWSLMERASDFNNFLLESSEFNDLMEAMPIVMIDYCAVNEDDFWGELMILIMESNRDH